MASQKGVTQTLRRIGGDGGQGGSYFDDMTPAELKEREDLQTKYEAMLARQEAYMERRRADFAAQERLDAERRGCVFIKSCKLPDAVINYNDPAGFVPVDSLSDYGTFAILGARQADSSGLVPLELISGAVPAGLGSLALGGAATGATTTGVAATTSGAMIAGGLLGFLALLWPSSLGDSALYTEEQLRSLKQARTRMRLYVEPQADGSLKGYGFYTGSKPEWEMIDVIQFSQRGTQQVADFGDGVELIWTPAIDPTDTLGIPPLKGAPHTPHIWIFPPTKNADAIIVNPIYPPDYKDFILVFPADSGVLPLYIVLNVPGPRLDYHQAPKYLPGFSDAISATKKTSVKGGGKLRHRWKTSKGFILEWDYQHGAIEMYDKRGKHLGEFNHVTGEQNKPSDPARRIEP
ncbi:colicin E3/pyocin S6 family cytotoxin [Pseudomonas sp. CCC3.1]|uniref:colicin E3/pyocin S6 family cytotoxin n=1 Tax=Pseudomonas sp. CCC3.1 TaxID=3048607 RepID=UPI002AC9DF05|nr:colicin E3/pyocin S6 family cytotoxin [Pseudomonas sp. CCC3.1]MEB0205136.1 colicin E3/pyocin S6 family cytotoxin [Pseudomonas sp. CCC3.1]WPX35851.1 colicin E3/pyocin S6 family cytotoxin [Pseudomonas sp. CCC3.1]